MKVEDQTIKEKQIQEELNLIRENRKKDYEMQLNALIKTMSLDGFGLDAAILVSRHGNKPIIQVVDTKKIVGS